MKATYLGDPILDPSSLREVGNLGPVFIGVCRCTECRAGSVCRGISGMSHHCLWVGITLTPLHGDDFVVEGN